MSRKGHCYDNARWRVSFTRSNPSWSITGSLERARRQHVISSTLKLLQSDPASLGPSAISARSKSSLTLSILSGKDQHRGDTPPPPGYVMRVKGIAAKRIVDA